MSRMSLRPFVSLGLSIIGKSRIVGFGLTNRDFMYPLPTSLFETVEDGFIALPINLFLSEENIPLSAH